MIRHAMFISLFLVVSSSALAKTMTAVCGPFKGHTIGISGASENHNPLNFEDSMDRKFTLAWEVGAESGQIIGSGENPTREEGFAVMTTEDQISFVVIYPISVFIYSIFPERKTMLITKHTHSRGLEFDAARGFIMRGDCTISFK